MVFWDLAGLPLEKFRPGIMSRAEIGADLTMVCMEIAPGKEDEGHHHPFDQCGLILEGKIEMFVEKEKKTLNPNDAYFIPAGKHHGWKIFETPAKILDITPGKS
jgi:quercetin dioxygenase-like cupin family protein